MTRLVGRFLEICSCDVICGCCWVDPPDFRTMTCSGISLWAFDPGSTIDGVDIAGSKACVVSTHFGTKKRPVRAAFRLFIDASSHSAYQKLDGAFGAGLGPLGVVARMDAARLPGLPGFVAERAQITVAGIASATPKVSVGLAGGPDFAWADGIFGSVQLTVPEIDRMKEVDVGHAELLRGALTLDPAQPPAALPFIELNLTAPDSRSATRARFDFRQ